MDQQQPKTGEKSLNRGVFLPAIIVIALIVAFLLIFPEQGNNAINAALHWIEYNLDWFFEVGNFIFLAVALWLGFGRYGKIRLGGIEARPEFSTLSWVAMLFCTGIGSSLIYWAILEPLDYMAWPPFGLEPMSAAAGEWGLPYMMFHWGIMGWVPAIIPGIAIGYAYHNRKNGSLRISSACAPLIGEKHANGVVGKIIDVFVIFGIMGAAATSLGVGVPMLSEAAGQLFGIEQSTGLQVAILLVWVCIFGFSVYSGLYKGIKKLSDINVYLAFFLLACILILGPTVFILSNFTNSFGMMMQNFIRMCFYTDPIAGSGFPQAWTVFFYAWWICYAPLIGIFLARVSRGRTFREVVLGCGLFASAGCWLVAMIFGGYGIHLQMNGIVPLLEIYQNGSGAQAVVAVITSLPAKQLFLVIFLVLQFIFMATTLDSAAFVMACNCTNNLRGEDQPYRWTRVVWALALGLLALGILLIGTLKAVQTTSIVGAVPILVIWFILIASLLKWLGQNEGKEFEHGILTKSDKQIAKAKAKAEAKPKAGA